MAKTALITGITGQDGSYLAELLLAKNYRVVGLGKQPSNINHLLGEIELVSANITHQQTMKELLKKVKPDEVYNLASQSYPGQSWQLPLETAEINGVAAHLLFETIRQLQLDCRIYQASSSEMFGEVTESPQNENTPFNPVNPYAAAKLYAHQIAKIYRKSYNMFISCGILFNHESPRRGIHFITQKVSYAAACLKLNIQNSPLLNENGEPIVKNCKLALGNLDAERDWGYAGDYVEAMWLMLQHPIADDFIIGTGLGKTIRELCSTAFNHVGLDWQQFVTVDSRLVRPIETRSTLANPSKAKTLLGWQPKKSFENLIADLVDYHLHSLSENTTKSISLTQT